MSISANHSQGTRSAAEAVGQRHIQFILQVRKGPDRSL